MKLTVLIAFICLPAIGQDRLSSIGGIINGPPAAPAPSGASALDRKPSSAKPLASDGVSFNSGHSWDRAGLPPAATPSTVAQWQAAAVAKYPELSQAGSRLNQLFVGWVKERRASDPQFFAMPDWPMRLADEVVKIKETEDARIGALREATQLVADGYTVTRGGVHLAAVSKDVLDGAQKLLDSGDQSAVQKLVGSGVLLVLKENLVVKVVDATILPPRVKIRAKGTDAEVWTSYDAVADPEPH